MDERIGLIKTYKLFVNGAFPRSERGRVLPQMDNTGKWVANVAWATRKDLRGAVEAARKAQAGWAKRNAFNRSQILFRMAELLEDRQALFAQRLVAHAGYSAETAARELTTAIDHLFFFAGWADKYTQVLGNINPVAESFFNFTLPEPTGVVIVLTSRQTPLLGLIDGLLPVIVSGNSAIAIVENSAPTLAVDFAELLAVSDLPAGVVNILTGRRDELIGTAASHMDVNALVCYSDDGEERARVERLSADNVKRTTCLPDPEVEGWLSAEPSLYALLPTLEFKTAWHPIGQ
jgi:acyl-CoA reductase-like NAD-dependent aldehyde dehydrogenase